MNNHYALIGADGMLGREIHACAVDRKQHGGLFAFGHNPPDPLHRIEVMDGADVERKLEFAFSHMDPAGRFKQSGGPTRWVVNLAAFHDVEACEEDPWRALEVNALGASNVARVAARLGARCAYVSTDHVFGHQTAASAATPPAPLNVYGASKLIGEVLVRQAGAGNLVVRTAALFGRFPSRKRRPGQGFYHRAARAARAVDRGELAPENWRVVNDQLATPTCARCLAEAILGLTEAGADGVVHVVGAGEPATWWELACLAAEAAGAKARPAPEETPGCFPPKLTYLVAGAPNLCSTMPPWRDCLRRHLQQMAWELRETLDDAAPPAGEQPKEGGPKQ